MSKYVRLFWVGDKVTTVFNKEIFFGIVYKIDNKLPYEYVWVRWNGIVSTYLHNIKELHTVKDKDFPSANEAKQKKKVVYNPLIN